MRSLAILGSTGSIGTQTLEVAASCGHRVLALTAHHNIDLLERQARTFHPILAAAADPTAAAALASRLADTDIQVLAGEEGVLAAAQLPQADTAVTALVGIAGLAPTLATIDTGKRIALANKETLVCAGPLVMARAREKGGGDRPRGLGALGHLPESPGQPRPGAETDFCSPPLGAPSLAGPGRRWRRSPRTGPFNIPTGPWERK